MQRDQNKTALCQPWMRNFKARSAHHKIVEEQNIQVERARAVHNSCGAVAAKVLLDVEHLFKQRLRAQLRFEPNHGIHKSGLARESNRLGQVKRRAVHHRAKRFKAHHRCRQSRLGRTGRAGQVGAHSNVGGAHPIQSNANTRPCAYSLRLLASQKRGYCAASATTMSLVREAGVILTPVSLPFSTCPSTVVW